MTNNTVYKENTNVSTKQPEQILNIQKHSNCFPLPARSCHQPPERTQEQRQPGPAHQPPPSFLSPHWWKASSFHHSHPCLDELHLSGSHFYNGSWERALRDCGPSPGLSQGPSTSSPCSCYPWRTAWHTAGDQYSCWKKSTPLVLVRLFLSRGYNLSIKRLVPAWDEAGERRRGAPLAELSAEVAHSAVTQDRVRGATDPGPTLEASRKVCTPHALKAPSLPLFPFQSREFATLETLPEAWAGILGMCGGNGAALTTLNEGTRQCGNTTKRKTPQQDQDTTVHKFGALCLNSEVRVPMLATGPQPSCRTSLGVNLQICKAAHQWCRLNQDISKPLPTVPKP